MIPKTFLFLVFFALMISSFGRNPIGQKAALGGWYYPNKGPLQPDAYQKLPVGAIKPEGWLKEFLIRQRQGLTGNLGTISAWLQKQDNAWLSQTGLGAWGWEELPYWLKGYGDLGYILQDSSVLAETKIWIEGVLNSQRPDGDFGPIRRDGSNRDFWGNMIMLYCLQSYYEYSNDTRVLTLMSRYFQFQNSVPDDRFVKGYWQGLRAGDNLHSVIWLYNRTGEPFLLDLMKKIHRCMRSWGNRENGIHASNHPQKNNPDWYGLLVDWHNVNVAQGFREPATYYQVSGDSADLKASYEVFRIVRDYFGQVPGGMFGSDEVARPGYSDPHQGIETCGIVEQMNSDEHLLRITGDLRWADHAEEVAFNMYPVTFTPDFRALHYLSAPNMVACDDRDHSPGVMNDGPFLMYNPFSSRCCQHNHAQGWPYFVENLWMATPDKGAFAALYSACESVVKVGDGTLVRFTEQTHYPFEDKIVIRMTMDHSVHFPLHLRIPGWCKGAKVRVNGRIAKVSPTGGKVTTLVRKWRSGDLVELTFPMEIKIKRWEQNHQSASVMYGPLTFSLKIKENYVRKESEKTALSDSKWQSGADAALWPSFEILPASDWNFGLLLAGEGAKNIKLERKEWPADNYPFTPDGAPLILSIAGKKLPQWTMDEHDLCGSLPESPVVSDQPEVNLELIPMGAARLRISAFPVVK